MVFKKAKQNKSSVSNATYSIYTLPMCCLRFLNDSVERNSFYIATISEYFVSLLAFIPVFVCLFVFQLSYSSQLLGIISNRQSVFHTVYFYEGRISKRKQNKFQIRH